MGAERSTARRAGKRAERVASEALAAADLPVRWPYLPGERWNGGWTDLVKGTGGGVGSVAARPRNARRGRAAARRRTEGGDRLRRGGPAVNGRAGWRVRNPWAIGRASLARAG